MNVLKFGGAVLDSLEGLQALANVLQQERSNSVVVVSAFGKTTRNLLQAASSAQQGELESAKQQLAEISNWHAGFALSMQRKGAQGRNAASAIRRMQMRLEEIFRGVALTGQLTARTRDLIASFGEYMALEVVAETLEQRAIRSVVVDATEVIVTDDNFGDAKPDIHATQDNIATQMRAKLTESHVLTQGFVARSHTGQITTMGIESSSLTAAIIASALSVDSMYVYSDVEGVRTADPAHARKHKLVPTLSYAQAHSAALNGVKVLHPRMLEPLKQANIPLFVRSAFHPGGEETKISAQAGENYCIAAMHRALYILHCGYQFRTDLPEYEGVLLKLYPDRIGLLSDTYRRDSACIVATRPPTPEVFEHLTGFDFVLETKPVVTLIGVNDEQALLRRLYEMSQVPTDFLEVGQQPGIVRIGAKLEPNQLYHTVLQLFA